MSLIITQCLFRMDIIKKIKVFAFGLNSTRKNYNNKSTHAEVDAMKKIQYKKIEGKMDLIVIKLSKNGEFRESRPCLTCLKSMRGLKIKHVYYSTVNGDIQREKFNGMEENPNTYLSYGHRKMLKQSS